MNWHKESMALDRIWSEAKLPPIGNQLAGVWQIEMATGLIPALKCHVKCIWYTGLFCIGGNKTGLRWGTFKVYEKQNHSVLEYDKWPIQDKVRQAADGLLIGKFFWRNKFKGYFWMTREELNDED